MNNYSLEELITIFTEHNRKYQISHKKNIEDFKENNPGVKLPDHFTDTFSLPLALRSICQEIFNLKFDLYCKPLEPANPVTEILDLKKEDDCLED